MPIDALDNGEGERISMTISSVISISNPFWNSPISGDEAFLKSVDFMRTVFHVYIEYLRMFIVIMNLIGMMVMTG